MGARILSIVINVMVVIILNIIIANWRVFIRNYHNYIAIMAIMVNLIVITRNYLNINIKV